MGYSYVKLTVSPACYDEIRALLKAATHERAIMKSGTLDMTGFGLVRGTEGPENFRFEPSPYHPTIMRAVPTPAERPLIPGELKVTCEN